LDPQSPPRAFLEPSIAKGMFPTLFDPTDSDPVTILGPAAITLGRAYNGLVLYICKGNDDDDVTLFCVFSGLGNIRHDDSSSRIDDVVVVVPSYWQTFL
jgi:hypothetical protein